VSYELVVIGTSWGGLGALRELVSGLPGNLELPLVVVPHRHRQSQDLMTPLIQDRTMLHVREIEDKSPITPGAIHIAPADYHVLVEDGHFALSTEAPVNYSRPSIDVTFTSVADAFAERSVGVILTGANDDGARGLKRIADRGGLALVQLPATAESPLMPNAALRSVPNARVLTLAEIAATLASLPVGSKT
jgi:two-component system, chemotaxis family, protein-glutamate methylesterase/glutaminase